MIWKLVENVDEIILVLLATQACQLSESFDSVEKASVVVGVDQLPEEGNVAEVQWYFFRAQQIM